jgi:hypothetical protein
MNNPIVIRFSNERIRPIMVDLASAYWRAKQALQEYDTLGLDALLAHDTTFSDILEDGAPGDGRPPISAGAVRLTVEALRQLVQHVETSMLPTGKSLIQGATAIAPFIR